MLDNHKHSECKMYNSFWWKAKYKNFLFYGFNLNTAEELLLTCIVLATLSFLLEGLKVLQAKHHQKELFLRSKQLRTICPAENLSLMQNDRTNKPVTIYQRAFLIVWEFSAWLNVQILNLFLMLSVMGYNGWMLVAVVIGSGAGYFVFGQCLMKINLQNCQIVQGTFCVLEPQIGESTPILRSTPASSSAGIGETTAHCSRSNFNS